MTERLEKWQAKAEDDLTDDLIRPKWNDDITEKRWFIILGMVGCIALGIVPGMIVGFLLAR